MQVRKLPEPDREYMRQDKINRLPYPERRDEVCDGLASPALGLASIDSSYLCERHMPGPTPPEPTHFTSVSGAAELAASLLTICIMLAM